jgi:tRNA dimethylallyltransferase
MAHKKCIILSGPTASGKTAMAIEWAQQHNTEIISADSRQCYTELNIGVARPSAEQLAQVPHHFIATHSIHTPVNAAVFEQYALQKIQQLFIEHNTVIMVGGTGLYIKAFVNGLDDVPPIDQTIVDKWNTLFEEKGLSHLQEQIQLLDPQFGLHGETQNPHRLLRALQVIDATGKSILNYQTGQPKQRDFEVEHYTIDVDRALLYNQINQRVDAMMQAGLLQEAELLYAYRNNKALHTVGYTELFDYFDGKYATLEEAVGKIKQHTRNYAKRQITWFKSAMPTKFLPAKIS